MNVQFRDRLRRLLAWPALVLLATCGTAPEPDRNAAPATATVRDGIDPDVDADRQEQRSSLFASWDAFPDPEGDQVVYEWCIGRSPGGSDVMPWTAVGGAQRAATIDTLLPSGVALYIGVRATDLHGQTSDVAASDGIVLGVADRSENRTEPARRPAAPPAVTPSVAPPPAKPQPANQPISAPTTNPTTTNPPPIPTAPAPQPRTEPTPAGGDVARATSIERFGIRWTFARPVECGQFVNGDWWIAGPAEIVTIDPPSRTEEERTRNGSMINPDPRETRQGYDSSMFGPDGADRFDATKNVGNGVSRERRLRLEPGTSLVSTISHAQPGQLPQLETCAVLTCLPSPPPKDAFRPPYCGRDKQCRWLASSLDLSKLARLEAPDGAPTPTELLPRFERTWLDHIGGWTGRYLHPRENMPDYGRDIADLVGIGALTLQLDFPDDEKRPLAIALIQLGIDLQAIVKNGGRFLADGGSGSGRKFPVLFAATMLRDREMLALVRDQKLAFAEDVQTFYVTQTAPGVWNNGHGDYGPDDDGLPEWGNQHADDPSVDRKSWASDPFRRCCTANVWHGFVLAARIMGLREAWDHPALFDYVDRYMQIEASGSYQRSVSRFAERMWDRYRAAY